MVSGHTLSLEPPDQDSFLRSLCRTRFDAFQQKAFSILYPGVDYEYNWHLGCVSEHLQALHEDQLPEGKQRLAIFVPPRSLKSTLASQAFPAWVMGNEPHSAFICTSYNFKLAKEMSQKTRIICEDPWYQETFPNMRIDNRQNEKHNFWTDQRGFYYSSPILSATGRGGRYVIIDDPINPSEAMSPTIRENTNETIANTIPTRFNDPRKAKWILIMQRLHEDDPGGRFAVKDDRWHVLKLPGENRTGKTISYSIGGARWDYEPDTLLFEQRLPQNVLDELRIDLGEYNYAGQILQEPVPIAGGEFKTSWRMNYSPGGIKPKQMNVFILVDPSGGEQSNKRRRKTSDYTVMMVVGLAPDNNYYLLDAVRDRLNPTERIDTLFMLHRKWNDLCGKPPKVAYEKYGLQSDTHYINERKKHDAYNFPLIEVGGAISKEDRIRRMIPYMQSGRWWFPPTLMYVDMEGRAFDLCKELWEGELATFPRARYDDMSDALARIYEPELYATFPAKQTMAQKAVSDYSANRGSDNWMDF